jgi:hypothetical protein
MTNKQIFDQAWKLPFSEFDKWMKEQEEKAKKEYILECPFCGQKHSINKNRPDALLNHPNKIFSLQCADSFSNAGCKNTIVICSQETLKTLRI